MNGNYKKYLFLALFFGLGFAFAMLIGRSVPVASGVKEAAVHPVDAAGVSGFLDAAKRGDYAGMAKIGEGLFRKGASVPDAGRLFKEYAANSYPPYTVYAFYSEGSDTRVRRVLLTLDEKERVESFLAEEMAVTN